MRALVKICGVTRPEDAALAAELGADFLGLNFHPPSPRALDPEKDAALLAEIAGAAGAVPLVGVFVHRPPAEIEEIAASAGLALIQLHGGEDPELARRFGARAIQVFRRPAPPPPMELARYPDAWGFLFDRPPRGPRGGAPGTPDPYGGTGESWDHGALRKLLSPDGPDGLDELAGAGSPLGGRPVLVAGGVRPDNARAVLAASGARGIDVCSGVESAPGVKEPDLMRRLFQEVHDGDAAP
ncbi:MAG: phosphoribosylanthranilate isomerase [Thermoanaerobaculia bacterium]